MREFSWFVIGMFFGLNIQYWISRTWRELHDHFHEPDELDENCWGAENEDKSDNPWPEPSEIKRGYDKKLK